MTCFSFHPASLYAEERTGRSSVPLCTFYNVLQQQHMGQLALDDQRTYKKQDKLCKETQIFKGETVYLGCIFFVCLFWVYI